MKLHTTITLIEGRVLRNVDEYEDKTDKSLTEFYARLLGAEGGKNITFFDDLAEEWVAINPDYVSHISVKEVN